MPRNKVTLEEVKSDAAELALGANVSVTTVPEQAEIDAELAEIKENDPTISDA